MPARRTIRPCPHALYPQQRRRHVRDVSQASGIAAHAGPGMGMVCADYDNDGDTDIFVLQRRARRISCSGTTAAGSSTKSALAAGSPTTVTAMPTGSMGVDCGDYDNDGWLDFYMTAYQRELPMLYRNLGDGVLRRCRRGGPAPGRARCTTSPGAAGLVDFDNDGDRDLFIACGHLNDNVDAMRRTTSYRARNVLLRNRGDGTFDNISDQAGDGMLPVAQQPRRRLRRPGQRRRHRRGGPQFPRAADHAPQRLRHARQHHWLQVSLRGRADQPRRRGCTRHGSRPAS